MGYDHPREVRALIRRGELLRLTCGLVPGYTQANLVVLPKELAFDAEQNAWALTYLKQLLWRDAIT